MLLQPVKLAAGVRLLTLSRIVTSMLQVLYSSDSPALVPLNSAVSLLAQVS
jgi:hypothetical protein